MDSRQVILLTKGYLAGWLNFTYPNKLSYLREQFILSQLEKEATIDIVKLKATIQANYISVNPKEAGKASQAALDDFSELTLPYIFKQSNIDVNVNGTKPPEEWKAILDSLNKK